MKRFEWNEEKNSSLQEDRGICFEEIVEALKKGNILDRYEHPNKEKYPHQEIIAVELGGSVYLVPFIEDEEKYFLKTAYRSGKATKKYMKNKEED